ncbi:hypothetical protein EOI86_07135 [Hwanghaeella grinnelliae]|uniref:Uncharacterized protein n=1 Tax=Hwanghaeella grinnelliae TaxID=2500179 RepID=A0A437QWX5_9PROT|nr:hypothetical protein [Hwanghaeella grinnelliae]RVU39024.1 hypothetical protein EOI86_07135 [Hwanghaeella grinnelliae]
MSATRIRENRPKTDLEKVYEKRRRAYKGAVQAVKGVAMDETANIGFVLDAVVGQLAAAIAAGDITATPEMTDLITRFLAVKTAFPKP